MKILVEEAHAEIEVKRSRFIALAVSATTAKEAREKLMLTKKQYKDARHVVHAFCIGVEAQVQGMSDDGEPQGTASRPIMDVIKGSGITNILLCVVRYFGGTLLGTGGLVKAYSGVAKLALSQAKTQEYVLLSPFSFSADYATYQSAKAMLDEYGVTDLSENFAQEVLVKGSVATSLKGQLVQSLKDVSRGRILCT